MPVNEKIEVSDDKQNSFLVKFKRSLRIGKKCKEKDPGTSSLAGHSQTNQQSSLKYVSLIPAHRMKKKAKDTDQGGEKVSEEGEGSGLVNVVDEEELPTFSGGQESKERSLPDVGNIDVTNKKSESGTDQETEGAEEQRRLYRAMHEVRKELIMKEKQFHEENLEFYKRQLEAEDIFGHGLQE